MVPGHCVRAMPNGMPQWRLPSKNARIEMVVPTGVMTIAFIAAAGAYTVTASAGSVRATDDQGEAEQLQDAAGNSSTASTTAMRTITPFCRTHASLCVWNERRRREVAAWREFTDTRGRRAALRRAETVSVWWRCKDCSKVFGHVFPALMRGASNECPVRCVEAGAKQDADVAIAMWADNIQPSGEHQLIARLNLEGRGEVWSSGEMSVPAGGQGRPSSDLLVSFRPESDVVISYGYAITDLLPCLADTRSATEGNDPRATQTECVRSHFARLPQPAWPNNHGAIAVAFVSNCDPWRKALYLELAKVVSMDFYGRCIQRRRHAPPVPDDHTARSMVNIASR